MSDASPPADASERAAARRSNAPFWTIVGAFALAGTVILVGTLLSRPDPPSQDAATNLRTAADAARVVEESRGSLGDATADELLVVEVRLDFVEAGEPSTRPSEISVEPGPDRWVGAALDQDGTTCHVLELTQDASIQRTALGGACTAARASADDRG